MATVTNSVPMFQLVASDGYYPLNGAGGTSPNAYNLIGMIQTSACARPVFGAQAATGQVVAIETMQPLAALLGNQYGGTPDSSFAYPDLQGRAVIGGTPGAVSGNTLALNWIIATQPPAADAAGVPYPFLGAVAMFAGPWIPAGWTACDGRELEIRSNYPLYAALGLTYGGDGSTTFALPDLRGRTPVGVNMGAAWDAPLVNLGQQVTVDGIDALGLNYLICPNGVDATFTGTGAFPNSSAFTGQVVVSACKDAWIEGWMVASGEQLSIEEFQALYAYMGDFYGGNGVDSVDLPNLCGRMVVGQSTEFMAEGAAGAT